MFTVSFVVKWILKWRRKALRSLRRRQAPHALAFFMWRANTLYNGTLVFSRVSQYVMKFLTLLLRSPSLSILSLGSVHTKSAPRVIQEIAMSRNKRRRSYSFLRDSAVLAVFHTVLFMSDTCLLGFPALGKRNTLDKRFGYWLPDSITPILTRESQRQVKQH